MFTIVMALASAAAYGPPTSHDAFEAFTDRILVEVREMGDVLREEEISYFPSYPSDVRLERCVPRAERRVRLRNGAIVSYSGHECILEVWPNAEAPYRTSGFFRHDGFRWRYHGPVQETPVPSPSDFDRQSGEGELVLKAGALAYDGNPKNPLNEDYDPYEALRNSAPWLDEN